MTTKVCKSKRNNPIEVGNPVFIRTVTHYYTGRIVEIGEREIILDDAAWIACTKRLNETLITGEFDEVEPFPNPVAIGRGAIVDVTHWTKPLPTGVK